MTINDISLVAITPCVGLNGGGTLVTITGTGFGAGIYVGIGGVLATEVTIVSDTVITAVTPARTDGSTRTRAVDVSLSLAADLSGGLTLRQEFIYTAQLPPVPVPGPEPGGTGGGSATGFQVLAGPPAGPGPGQVYFDSNDSLFKGFDGSAWVVLTPGKAPIDQ